jgi:hypothetical protein
LYYLLTAEIAFVQLQGSQMKPLDHAPSLAEIREYAKVRQDLTKDPTFWLEYHLLSGIDAFRRDRPSEARTHLDEFESVTKQFGVRADAEYVSQMRKKISSGDLDGGQRVLAKRLTTFFPRHFEETMAALDDKILMMLATTADSATEAADLAEPPPPIGGQSAVQVSGTRTFRDRIAEIRASFSSWRRG